MAYPIKLFIGNNDARQEESCTFDGGEDSEQENLRFVDISQKFMAQVTFWLHIWQSLQLSMTLCEYWYHLDIGTLDKSTAYKNIGGLI